ncbi:hypothetical protein D5b_00322 [Faustovirus]|nr:hypothetical protein D5b_00322 [Faustovirus]AMN84592.1 hypothetical protein D6_00186 [Faustovirus]AMP44268.1 hypothetical protein PRJ_Dakar_00315 [Faustovirus]
MENWHIALLVAVVVIVIIAVWRMKKAEGCCGEKFLPVTGDNWLARGIPETMYIPIRGDNWLAR